MVYCTLRPNVKNLDDIIAMLERYCKGDRANEWVASAFEVLSNIIEHNFYGKKIPSLSPYHLKRESKKHHKHKILIKIYTQMLPRDSHLAQGQKRFALHCFFSPIFPPQLLFKPHIYKFCLLRNSTQSLQTPQYRLSYGFLQNGRGMRIIYRFCTLRLVKITPKKYSITLKGHK